MDIGDVANDVGADDHVRRTGRIAQGMRRVGCEESIDHVEPLLPGDGRYIRRRFNTARVESLGHQVCQQRAIVTADLDSSGLGASDPPTSIDGQFPEVISHAG